MTGSCVVVWCGVVWCGVTTGRQAGLQTDVKLCSSWGAAKPALPAQPSHHYQPSPELRLLSVFMLELDLLGSFSQQNIRHAMELNLSLVNRTASYDKPWLAGLSALL